MLARSGLIFFSPCASIRPRIFSQLTDFNLVELITALPISTIFCPLPTNFKTSCTSQGGRIYGPNSLLQSLLEKNVALSFLPSHFSFCGVVVSDVFVLSPWDSFSTFLSLDLCLGKLTQMDYIRRFSRPLATDWVLPMPCSRVRKERGMKVFRPRFPPWRVSHIDWVPQQSSPLYRPLLFLPLFPLGVGR